MSTPGIERSVAQSARWHWQSFPHAELEPSDTDFGLDALRKHVDTCQQWCEVHR